MSVTQPKLTKKTPGTVLMSEDDADVAHAAMQMLMRLHPGSLDTNAMGRVERVMLKLWKRKTAATRARLAARVARVVAQGGTVHTMPLRVVRAWKREQDA